MISMNNILAVVLGGGRGSRLYPLTRQRSKPAVPMAGKYRLIDIPMSNCINSGIYHVAVLTQFNSVSLHAHIARTYHFDSFHSGWVQIWAAEQTIHTTDWYQGTADAVRKQLFEIKSARADYVLILAGDHLYRMDYSAMARFHEETQADITIAVQPVAARDVGRFGILKRDPDYHITRFVEKPSDQALQSELVSRDDPVRPYLGSMGIYLFNTSALLELIENTVYDDFGKQVIPAAIKDKRVAGFDFDDYWEDIGTIRSFYETNLALTGSNAPFSFFEYSGEENERSAKPVYTNPRFLPGTIVENSHLEHVLLAEGCHILSADIRHSVIGLRSQIRGGAKITDCVLLGADYYDKRDSGEYVIPLGIGENCELEGAIIDKNARIGDNVVIKPFPTSVDIGKEDEDRDWYVREGIVVIPKNATVPSGTVISPEIVGLG